MFTKKVTRQEIAVTKNKGFCCLTKIVGFQTLLMASLKFVNLKEKIFVGGKNCWC